MELYNIIVYGDGQVVEIAEGLTLQEAIDLVATINRSKPPGTECTRKRTKPSRIVELLKTERVTVGW